MSSAPIRLQRFLAQAGVASRRAAELLISEGKVSVNGASVREPGLKIRPGVDVVRMGKTIIQNAEMVSFIFHKPRGFLCNEDPRYLDKCIFKVYPELKPYRVAVGLEKAASGLILLTNDGDLHQALTRNMKGLERKFAVRVREEIDEKTMERLKKGMTIEEQHVVIRGLKFDRTDAGCHWYNFSVRDLRDKVLAKVFKTAQHPLQKMVQTGIGNIQDNLLKKSTGRILTAKELSGLRKLVGMSA